MAPEDWTPTHDDPVFILAMDHRDSFGSSLFGVKDDSPSDDQLRRMRSAKDMIYDGLLAAAPKLTAGRPGVLVDEQLGDAVIRRAHDGPVVLACPVEASGHDWFTLEYGDEWFDHVRTVDPAYVKVLVRDNPDFDDAHRRRQLDALHDVSERLDASGYRFLYELLVPATDDQLASVDKDDRRYDAEVRPDLVARVIADNQAAGVEPTIWKVEGLETVDACRHVAAAARADGRTADLVVLGRDAPAERLDHWLETAAQVEEFVGFAIGRSIWEDVVRDLESGDGSADDRKHAVEAVSERYLGFTSHWHG